MRKTLFIAAMAFVVMVSAGIVLAQQQNYGQGHTPQGQGWLCPWSGQQQGQGMGPGMMQGWQGRGMGPGMMHRGQGMMQGWQGQGLGPGMMHGPRMGRGMMHDQWGRGQNGPNAGQQQMQSLDQNAARELARNYTGGNPNLKIGEVTEQDGSYEATIVTKNGSLVEKLLIDKQTGGMKKAF
ncbi:MAG: hypothetical protein R6U55_02140 [Desulfovermiculus sp.]